MPFVVLAAAFGLLAQAGLPPAPAVATNATDAPRADYRIRAGDEIEVRLFYHPDLLQVITVRPDGMISFPLIDDQRADGRTPRELARQIERELARELQNSQTSVQVKRFAQQRVYVGGEVANAGVLPLSAPMTTMQAIMQAGGFRRTARINRVAVIRTVAAQKTEILLVNLDMPKRGQPQVMNDLELQALDVVFVPKSRIASVNDFVEQYVTRLVPIQYILGVQFYPLGIPLAREP